MLRNIFQKLSNNKLDLYGAGVVFSGTSGGLYASYKTMEDLKESNFIETTAYTSVAFMYGGLLGVGTWVVLPLVIPVAGVVYLHKNIKDKKEK